MKPLPLYPRRSFVSSRSRGGAALVITLAVLVLMTIMVVSLNDLMRIERGSARSHVEKTRAEMLAQRGVASVIARLRQVTANPGRNWISQPGQLVAGAASGTPKDLQDPIALSSGSPSPAALSDLSMPAYLKPAELNVSTFDPPTSDGIQPHLISNPTLPGDGNAVQMPLAWIYVRRDGLEDLAEQPNTADAANPIVGRYAYWTDDESSKVNYNLAWTRGANNPNPPSHPTKVNLPTLLGADSASAEMLAAAIHLHQAAPAPRTQDIPATTAKYRTLSRFFFSTPEDARQVEQVSAGVYDALSAAKFSVTHYNHDPDTTFFNEPRIVLTCRKDRAAGRPFLDIGINDNSDLWDPVATIGLGSTKLADVIDKLNSYLKRRDWPIAPGSSLQDKYYAGRDARLTQLSLNIINYVRSKESKGESVTKVVVPVRGEQLPGGRFVLMEVATSANAYIGVTRTPKINEMGVWVSDAPTSTGGTTYSAKYKVEIYLPPQFGLDQIDLTLLSLYVSANNVPGSTVQNSSQESTITASEVVIPSGSGTILRAGEYATVTRNATVKFSGTRPTESSSIGLRFAIHRVRRLDVTPLGTPAVCTLDPPATADGDISSIEIDDPRVNTHKDDWKRTSDNTFGEKNSISTVGNSPTGIVPEQDVDKSGKITDISLVIPAPDGTSNSGLSSNPNGVMASAGELGYIHTGMESGAGAGIPWRTLRLQPNNQPASVLPDWGFMDLFTVPADVPPDIEGQPSPKAIFSPHDTATGGRVNMNAKPEPFNLDRIQPLAAVFQGARKDATDLSKRVSYDEAQIIADNIYRRRPAAKGKQYGYQDGYDSPGEVVEIKGIADSGEESEQLVREIANLITSRGNVFSIYSVGQALKQTPAGKLVVTGEQRQQTMVERYATDEGEAAPTGNSVQFRTIYHRNLLP
ncbi:MAG: hypothetical protein M3463_00515 [Verrucomicrobiota bacterium]|nr:hypothetical protein [Verrucomicrobiota bacterium]